MNPKISIVIPTYNTQKYIIQAIQSALWQTYENKEIIVVNDGSTDDTIPLIEKSGLMDKIILINKKNGGTASALNAGIRQATGEWIKWLSSDDLLYTKCLEQMMEKISILPDKESHIYYTHYEIIDEKRNTIKRFMEPNHNSLPLSKKNAILYSNYYGNGTTSLIHKSVFEKIGYFDESLRTGDDYDFWLRASFNGIDLYLIDILQAGYRVHTGQMTKTKLKTVIKNVEIIRKRALELLTKEQQTQLKKDIQNFIPFRKKIGNIGKSIIFEIFSENVALKILKIYMKMKLYFK